MSELMYNILWIDDEHETLGGTKGRAKRNGINLIPFKSLNGGIGELSRNYHNYDGVLLDAKFFENEDDTQGSEDTFNVHRAKEELLQLKKKFEIFVLTGQAEAYEDKTFRKSFTKVYRKGSDGEIDKLFTDIKEAASNQVDTQIRHTYKRVFDVCTENYIGENAGQDLLNLLKVEDDSGLDHHFNSIRKIIEDLFGAFHKFNLLPSEFVVPTVALNQSSTFLAGKEQHERTDDKYKVNKHLEGTHLPEQIANSIWSILSITQSGSHRSKVDNHVHLVKTPFLVKSVLFQLLDVLVWFKIYVDDNPKTGNWERVTETVIPVESNPWIEGEVINFNIYKGYAFLAPFNGSTNVYIPPHLVSAFSLTNGNKVRGEIEEYPDNRTGEIKSRVKSITID